MCVVYASWWLRENKLSTVFWSQRSRGFTACKADLRLSSAHCGPKANQAHWGFLFHFLSSSPLFFLHIFLFLFCACLCLPPFFASILTLISVPAALSWSDNRNVFSSCKRCLHCPPQIPLSCLISDSLSHLCPCPHFGSMELIGKSQAPKVWESAS